MCIPDYVYLACLLRFCSYCLYKSSLYWDYLLFFAILSCRYCSDDIGVSFTCLTVLITILTIFVMCILSYDHGCKGTMHPEPAVFFLDSYCRPCSYK